MAQLSQMELQSLRHLVGESLVGAKKLGTYAEQCQNSQLQQTLKTEAQKCRQKADKFMSFLQ